MGIWLLGILLAVGILLTLTRLGRFKNIASELAAGVLLASLPFVVAFTHQPLLIFAAATHVWLILLPARLIFGRLEPEFLLKSTRRNSILGAFIAVFLCTLQVGQPEGYRPLVIIACLTLSIAVGVYFFGQIWKNTRRYKITPSTKMPALKDLPTVSVCIPARNEDHALSECLQSVVASDYPKLEVIVLDDCSQDATSDIVRSFAQDGVRFIQGDVPAAGWLGKNQARQTLAEHATGQYILFLDVDTHIGPYTVSHVVEYAMAQRLAMVSVLPQNRLATGVATTCATLDNFWRLVLPISPTQTPVASSFWLISADKLRSLGGFASVSRKIVPEESFAARLRQTNTYRFLVNDPSLAITTAKRWSSQIESAIRYNYPRARRQPYVTFAICTALAVLGIAPFAGLAACLVLGLTGPVMWLSLVASSLLLIDYFVVVWRVRPKSWLIDGWFLPLVLLQEITTQVSSMLQYEFAEVTWKGRNVCYPVVAPRPDDRQPLRLL